MKNLMVSFVLLAIAFAASGQIDSLIDARDGKIYRTIKIGNQTWMAENLAYVPPDKNSDCYKDSISNCVKYGRLYIWNVAVNVCPDGWHLPSKTEFETLLGQVGEKKLAFKELATGGKTGFDALLGGYYFYSTPTILHTTGYRNIDGVASFWSSTETNKGSEKTTADILIFGVKKTVFINVFYKKCAMSVRCVKD
jgi:uncharacterized protein (TIGR02145 family)